MFVQLRDAQFKDLKALAYCHMAAFPASLTTAMGYQYTKKTLEWYIYEPDAILVMAEDDCGKALGYAGGLLVTAKTKQGSTTAMSQFAFKDALLAICIRPWLVFHPQVKRHYPYIRYFIKRQLKNYFRNKKVPPNRPQMQTSTIIRNTMGLVGIGILPEFQGRGVGSSLLKAFESRSRAIGAECMDLSVEPENNKAIRSYERNGWNRVENEGHHFMMHKELKSN